MLPQFTPRYVSIHGAGLGDCWASVNWCLNQSDAVALHPVALCGQDRTSLILSIFRALAKTRALYLSSAPGPALSWREVYKAPYLRVKKQWDPHHRVIACQFHGKSKPRVTNCSSVEEKTFHEATRSFTVINLDRIGTLDDGISALIRCEYFVGVDSGYAHVACSVGLPVFVIRNGRTSTNIHEESFPGKGVISFSNMAEFLSSGVIKQ